MKEIWKQIEGFENYYEISNFGRVKSLARNIYKKDGSFMKFKPENIKKLIKTRDGYFSVKLCINGTNKSFLVHRLVANAFIDNPLNLPEVNHMDTDRSNNIVSNLEWTTHQDNVAYSKQLNRYKNKNGVNNPNYGNHALHDKYVKNPELVKKLTRIGSENGRSKSIYLYKNNILMFKFDCISDCVKWYRNTFNLSIKDSTVRLHIINASKENKNYNGYQIKIEKNNINKPINY